MSTFEAVEHDSLLDAVQIENHELNTAVQAGPASAAVPTCESWTVADLAIHVGSFCGFWSHILCEGTGRSKTPFPDPPADAGLARWLADLSDQLVELLAETPPSTKVWTWFDGDDSAAFVARRCAHELAVHCYDAQSARAACEPISARLALDGIDELLDVLTTARTPSGQATGRILALHCTDLDSDWAVRLGREGIVVDRPQRQPPTSEAGQGGSGGGGDLILSGTASDLELLLYNRPPLGSIDDHGDRSVLDEWYREFTF